MQDHAMRQQSQSPQRESAAFPISHLPFWPGWHPDPTGRHESRYFDGNAWRADVLDGEKMSIDPFFN
jgi:hypothetical protein